jgi:hypothetical protein
MYNGFARIANFHNVPLSVADEPSSYAVGALHAQGLSTGVADPARR